MTPNPNPYRYEINGVQSVDIYLKGGPEDPFEEDEMGFTIIKENEEYVYGVNDKMSGQLVSSKCKPGKCDPRRQGMKVHERPNTEVILKTCGKKCLRPRNSPLNSVIKRAKARKKNRKKQKEQNSTDAEEVERNLEEVEVMKNLVLMLQFSNHADRELPPKDQYEILFNEIGGHDTICKSGSVRDCFLFNSYGSFDLQSIVYDWILLPNDETYYADDDYGMSGLFSEVIEYALEQIDSVQDFNELDADGDGWIDAITILHSGYGAEWGGKDCYTEQQNPRRIWSHKFGLQNTWTSSENVRVRSYHVSPGIWVSSVIFCAEIWLFRCDVFHAPCMLSCCVLSQTAMYTLLCLFNLSTCCLGHLWK